MKLQWLLGFYLILDGSASAILVWDRRELWQIARMVRVAIGIVIMLM